MSNVEFKNNETKMVYTHLNDDELLRESVTNIFNDLDDKNDLQDFAYELEVWMDDCFSMCVRCMPEEGMTYLMYELFKKSLDKVSYVQLARKFRKDIIGK